MAGTQVPAHSANSAGRRTAFGFRRGVLLYRLAVVVGPRLAGAAAAGPWWGFAIVDPGLRLNLDCRSDSLDRHTGTFPGGRVARRRVTPARIARTRITLTGITLTGITLTGITGSRVARTRITGARITGARIALTGITLG